MFEDFTSVDLISDGRAEIIARRGAYSQSFPLFGYDLAGYDDLFDEKVDLLLQLNRSERVTWSGRHRTPLTGAGVYPRPVQVRLPVWIAVGGTPASVVRAGRHGLPLYLAILGQPDRFAPLADLYRASGAGAGHDAATLRVGVTSHFYGEGDLPRRPRHLLPLLLALYRRQHARCPRPTPPPRRLRGLGRPPRCTVRGLPPTGAPKGCPQDVPPRGAPKR